MSRTIFRRIFPPAFLEKAELRKVDVGAYLPPAKGATGVWVGQTAAQYENAVRLCKRLEAEGDLNAHHWVRRVRQELNRAARQIVDRSE